MFETVMTMNPPVRDSLAFAGAFILCAIVWFVSVSYTHLTLPTIYSV